MHKAVEGDAPVEVLIGDEVVLLRPDEVDRLLETLGSLDSREAADVAAEIAAQRLAGGSIRLLPTPAEEQALRFALAVGGGKMPLDAALFRLAGVESR